MSKFKVGDRVKVTSEAWSFCGQVGTVAEIDLPFVGVAGIDSGYPNPDYVWYLDESCFTHEPAERVERLTTFAAIRRAFEVGKVIEFTVNHPSAYIWDGGWEAGCKSGQMADLEPHIVSRSVDIDGVDVVRLRFAVKHDDAHKSGGCVRRGPVIIVGTEEVDLFEFYEFARDIDLIEEG